MRSRLSGRRQRHRSPARPGNAALHETGTFDDVMPLTSKAGLRFVHRRQTVPGRYSCWPLH